jgi:xanthine dehydrogenase large subunit
MGAQEHLYFETQVALAFPIDGSRIKIFSATQSPSAVQKQVAKVLDLPMHLVQVEAPRLGGAFGGKEEQAKPWAILAALAAYKLQHPVKLTLSRREDMHYTGKRHPYSADYRLGLDENRKIIAYEVMLYQDGGAVADLSTAVLERTLFHATNAYAIANVLIRAASCRTNHPSNTAFRGFGAPQAIFTLESALDHAARELKCPRWQLQEKNLIAPGYTFPYGMSVANDSLEQCWKHLWEHYRASARLKEIETYNEQHRRYKKALAFTPLCFGIAFTATHLNQASVLVHVYTDGSVSVSCSAVEMGQGVFEKIRTVAARSLYLPKTAINIEATNSSRTANMSPTAASVGSDLNGLATQIACQDIIERLLRFAAKHYEIDMAKLFLDDGDLYSRSQYKSTRVTSWKELVTQAYFSRINLSAHAHYATPHLYFERPREQGHPFAYHACGVSMIEASVDNLLGSYRIDHINVVYDLGESLDQQTDTGQMEGGLVQGVGYSCMEEIIWDGDGKLLTDNFASYKIPDLISAPTIDVSFLATADNPYAPFNSKAIGEPPFLLGIGSYFAILEAIRETADEPSLKKQFHYSLPMTPEKALFQLYPNETAKAK